MPAYVSKPIIWYQPPKCYWDDAVPLIEGKTVIVEEAGPIETGLLDQSGNKLYRLPSKHPVGFRIG